MVNGWRRRWLLLGFGLRESMSVCTRAPRHRWRPSLFRLLILECVLRDRRRPEEDGEVFVSNLSVPLAAQFTHVCGARDNCLLAFCVWGPFAGELSGIHPLQSLWGRRQGEGLTCEEWHTGTLGQFVWSKFWRRQRNERYEDLGVGAAYKRCPKWGTRLGSWGNGKKGLSGHGKEFGF